MAAEDFVQGEDTREGDAGTLLGVTFVDEDGNVVDISDATTKEIVFEKPDGSSVTEDAEFTAQNGGDGKAHYKTVADFLKPQGEWRRQGHAVTPSGEWHTEIVVWDNRANLS